jgi:hypothetical protein
VHVTPPAEGWVDQRELRADVRRVVDWGRKNPGWLAGIWFVNHSDDVRSRLVVALVDGTPESVEAALRALLTFQDAVSFTRREHSQADLLALQNKLRDRIFAIRVTSDPGAHATALGVNTDLSRLNVTLSTSNPDLADKVLALAPGWISVHDEPGVYVAL